MGKTIAMVFGWIFIILGVLGFISNPIVGANGIFVTDTLHNLVHLISGIIFLWVCYKSSAKTGATLKIFGIIYLLIAILGFFMSSGMVLGMMINGADNWLHLVLGLIFLWGGMKSGKAKMAMSSNEPIM